MWTKRNNLAYLKFRFLRLLIDLPFLTIETSLKDLRIEKKLELLNFGSGPSTHYDLYFAQKVFTLDPLEKADYQNLKAIPLGQKFDYILCLEVLEHCSDPVEVLASLSPFLKNDGKIILSTPLNARIHPSPQDFFRFTPDSISLMAANSDYEIEHLIARGSNLTTIANKILYLSFWALSDLRFFILGLISLPLALFFLFMAQLDLKIFKQWGDDPLGYTFVFKPKNHK